MKAMRKCNDKIYQLAKDQALVKKLKKLGLFVYIHTMYIYTWNNTIHCLQFSPSIKKKNIVLFHLTRNEIKNIYYNIIITEKKGGYGYGV